MDYKEPDFQRAMELSQTPAARQLLQLLQNNGGSQPLQSALSEAMRGDSRRAQELLAKLMEDPQAKKLLKELER